MGKGHKDKRGGGGGHDKRGKGRNAPKVCLSKQGGQVTRLLAWLCRASAARRQSRRHTHTHVPTRCPQVRTCAMCVHTAARSEPAETLGADGLFLPCFSLAAAAQESVEEREARLRAEEAAEEDEEMEEGEEGAASGRGQSRMVRRVGRRGRCVWVGA